jgi:hypothetical protein
MGFAWQRREHAVRLCTQDKGRNLGQIGPAFPLPLTQAGTRIIRYAFVTCGKPCHSWEGIKKYLKVAQGLSGAS